jgi:IS30 family transposase
MGRRLDQGGIQPLGCQYAGGAFQSIGVVGLQGAAAALEGFSRVLNGVPASMRKTLTYDQGKEIIEHKRLNEHTDIAVLFADPHSP